MEASPAAVDFRAPKKRVTAALFAVFGGVFGLHKFYLGYYQTGFMMLACSVVGGILTLGLGTGISLIISLIEGLIYLMDSDEAFQKTYVRSVREWF